MYNTLNSDYYKPSEDLGYLLGVLWGDGCIQWDAKTHWPNTKKYSTEKVPCRFRLRVIDKDFCEAVASAWTRQFGQEVKIRSFPEKEMTKNGYTYTRKEMFQIRQCSRQACLLLTEMKLEDVLQFPSMQIGFVRGIFDSEGSTFAYNCVIGMQNIDALSLISAICKGRGLNVRSAGVKETKSPFGKSWYLIIRISPPDSFLEVFPTSIERKNNLKREKEKIRAYYRTSKWRAYYREYKRKRRTDPEYIKRENKIAHKRYQHKRNKGFSSYCAKYKHIRCKNCVCSCH